VIYDVVDVTDWPVLSQESGGADAKDWITPPELANGESREQWWLYKPVKLGVRGATTGQPSTYRRHDDEAERIACALAQLVGVPSADVELARNSEREGIISRNVTPDGWSIQGGDVILSELPGYLSCLSEPRPKNRIGHNLANISRILANCGGPPGAYETWRAFDVFAGYLVFDAWIANTDRHAMNWAVLERQGRRMLAPTFDHGSALASGSADEDLQRKDPVRFSRQGMATRFEDGKTVTLVELAHRAVELASGRAPEWIERLEAITEADVAGVLGGVRGLSDIRRTFMAEVLQENRRRLVT